MEELNKFADSDVRIIYLPPMTIASACGQPHEIEKFQSYIDYVAEPYKEGKITMRDVLKKFIDDVDLFKIKPDTRIFRFQNYGDQNYKGYLLDINGTWASIPDDLDVPAPLEKIKFYGGLYAWYKGNVNLGPWLENNDKYEWAPQDGINRPIMEEFVDPFNRHGMKNTYSEETGFVTDTLFPIREIPKLTYNVAETLAKLDKIIPYGEQVEIDLMSMVLQKENDMIHELTYPNGLIELKGDNGWRSCGMLTPQQFNYPLKIELCAKTDKGPIILSFAQIVFGFNSSGSYNLDISENGAYQAYKKLGEIPNNEFFNVELILTKEGMAVKVNEELRYYGSDYECIKKFKENPDYNLSGAICVGNAWGSTIIIESLRVTEI